jgi:hypothetical protein
MIKINTMFIRMMNCSVTNIHIKILFKATIILTILQFLIHVIPKRRDLLPS